MNRDGLRRIFSCYYPTEDNIFRFEFGENNYVSSKVEQMAIIYGMNRIQTRVGDTLLGEWFMNSEIKLMNCELFKRYFLQGGKKGFREKHVSKKSIVEAILKAMKRREADDDEMCVCLIGLYLCCTLFFNDLLGNQVKVEYFGIVQDVETTKQIPWATLVHNYLFESMYLKYQKNEMENLLGCIPYLVVK